MTIVLNIDEEKDIPLYVQLYEGIKKEITEGRLESNTKMPSIREMAKLLNMSKTTIENTYHQLMIEGYIYSIEKKGCYVSEIRHTWIHPNAKDKKQAKEKLEPKVQYDLTNAYIEKEVFNEVQWKKAIDKVITEDSKALLYQGDVQGEWALRAEIIKYLYQARGVYAGEEQVVIGAGIQPLLIILSNIFYNIGIQNIGFEDPGFNRAKDVFSNSPLNLIPIDIKDKGIDIKNLIQSNVEVCYISPSHQFPTGTVMPIKKRSELIHWAELENAYIIEDDYNSELRFQGRPIPSLQGLNRGKSVIYLGSFSTVFLPSIRISYMVLPEALIQPYKLICNQYAQTASKLEQLAMAYYMTDGLFEKHIRRLKVHYSKKNDLIKKKIKEVFKEKVIIKGDDSGFNLYIEIKTNLSEKNIKEKARKKGIVFNVLSDYTVKENLSNNPVILLSYKGIDINAFEYALKAIYSICFTA
ncbi:GntR family transcriptional regulator/MocR family aminotransferase [Natranaerovirga hydrolytica]|uniref:GntR family transcriptional regulator/MocR family aminotransferase n=1 Tax=Natranaerovirga hydrolytica TaxID=680378 RepID=A0A4R1MHC9_9FIRM|nr:PLP-dependent aminotransferase family protein [Natranaerovirga hydrolytica]TCK90534.1 GntR family transcriptional regulator/MocR family aminotransferase [Natranaerovirga hydrolytica]